MKTIAATGLFAVLGTTRAAHPAQFLRMPNCTLTPSQTAGPFYFDPDQLRSDILEDRVGIPLRVIVYVVDANTCEPIPGAFVEIWHCDVDGAYSGYTGQGANGDMDTRGMTFLRGGLLTNTEGKAEFTTMYPGWYPGRATHIHFKASFQNQTYVTSQMYFPESFNSEVYAKPPYTTRGQNTTTNANDGIFRTTQNNDRLLTTTQSDGDGYASSITIGITGVPTSVDEAAAEPSYYRLDQNYPNPVGNTTNLTFSLPIRSEVSIAVFDLLGNKLGEIHHADHGPGTHTLGWNVAINSKRLARGNYFYQLTAVNAKGTFTQARYMTIAK